MFLGEYKLKFSGKGRIILPKKLREEIKDKEIILSKGFEGCIWGFDLKDWEKQAMVQLETSAVEAGARHLRRYLFSSSIEVELDDQGRFVIPGNLLDYGRVRDKVILVGAGDHFEVWDKDLWEKQLKTLERKYGRVSR
ncbi:MAG: division/cell wall cluster transcriptional repressor MraZ [Candidatus Daviesbacteria bacterium]|nr:division/cell wall cluster transcriptional repressor MraZ [Candidatus Daviesbacteria bacterium]